MSFIDYFVTIEKKKPDDVVSEIEDGDNGKITIDAEACDTVVTLKLWNILNLVILIVSTVRLISYTRGLLKSRRNRCDCDC